MNQRTTKQDVQAMFERYVRNTGLEDLHWNEGSKYYGNSFRVYIGNQGRIDRVLFGAWSKAELYEKLDAANSTIEEMRYRKKEIEA